MTKRIFLILAAGLVALLELTFIPNLFPRLIFLITPILLSLLERWQVRSWLTALVIEGLIFDIFSPWKFGFWTVNLISVYLIIVISQNFFPKKSIFLFLISVSLFFLSMTVLPNIIIYKRIDWPVWTTSSILELLLALLTLVITEKTNRANKNFSLIYQH